MQVDVLWYSNEIMSFGCCTLIRESFDQLEVTHHWEFGIDSVKSPPNLKGAIVCFHGGNESAIGRGPALAAIMSAELVDYKWVIWVSLGDEEDKFPLHLLHHRNCRIYAQTVKPGGQNYLTADRVFPEGYLPDTREILQKQGARERDLHWFFAGQDTHERRHQCIRALKASRDPFAVQYGHGEGREAFNVTSILIPTQAFGQGVSHETYYDFMARAKIVPCPAGPATPDSFRMAEALEAGCVPILDAHSPDGPDGYWDLVFPDHPFFVIEDWEKEWKPVMDEVLHDFSAYQRKSQYYWRRWKLDFKQWILRDMIALGAI